MNLCTSLVSFCETEKIDNDKITKTLITLSNKNHSCNVQNKDINN